MKYSGVWAQSKFQVQCCFTVTYVHRDLKDCYSIRAALAQCTVRFIRTVGIVELERLAIQFYFELFLITNRPYAISLCSQYVVTQTL